MKMNSCIYQNGSTIVMNTYLSSEFHDFNNPFIYISDVCMHIVYLPICIYNCVYAYIYNIIFGEVDYNCSLMVMKAGKWTLLMCLSTTALCSN